MSEEIYAMSDMEIDQEIADAENVAAICEHYSTPFRRALGNYAKRYAATLRRQIKKNKARKASATQ